MAIKKEVEVKQTSLRPTTSARDRVYTAAGRPRVMNTDFGRLGSALGDTVASAFDAIGRQAPENREKMRAVMAADPSLNNAEAMRKAGVSPFFSNQVTDAADFQRGENGYVSGVNAVLEEFELEVQKTENLEKNPQEISDLWRKMYHDHATTRFPDNIISRGAMIEKFNSTAPTVVTNGIVLAKNVRKENTIDVNTLGLQQGADNGYLIQTYRGLSGGLGEVYSKTESDAIMVESIKRWIVNPEFNSADEAQLSALVSEVLEGDPDNMNKLLLQARNQANINSNARNEAWKIERDEAWHSLMPLVGETLDEEQKQILTKYSLWSDWNTANRAYFEGNTAHMDPDDYQSLQNNVNFGHIPTKRDWNSMSPGQVRDIRNSHGFRNFGNPMWLSGQEAVAHLIRTELIPKALISTGGGEDVDVRLSQEAAKRARAEEGQSEDVQTYGSVEASLRVGNMNPEEDQLFWKLMSHFNSQLTISRDGGDTYEAAYVKALTELKDEIEKEVGKKKDRDPITDAQIMATTAGYGPEAPTPPTPQDDPDSNGSRRRGGRSRRSKMIGLPKWVKDVSFVASVVESMFTGDLEYMPVDKKVREFMIRTGQDVE